LKKVLTATRSPLEAISPLNSRRSSKIVSKQRLK
jgi:hypothetical protein